LIQKTNKNGDGNYTIQLPKGKVDYNNDKINEELIQSVINDCKEKLISCGMKTL